MRVGVFLPNLGESANPEAVITGAKRAEELGYDSVWVADRLLYPVKPRNKYPASPDGVMPEYFKRALDPLTTLTFVAAHTTKIHVGTSVLNIPFYHPLVLARALTSLDVLSGGRLEVGFGLGWSEDEFEAVGATAKGRGARASEFLDALKAIWGNDPVEFRGQHFTIPQSIIGLKPVQKPHPPVYLAAFTDAALRRVGRKADGWIPARMPYHQLERMLADLRAIAQAAGRDPNALKLAVLTIPKVTAVPITGERAPFSGSPEQFKEDVARTRALGADKLILQIDLGGPLKDSLAAMERLRPLVQ